MFDVTAGNLAWLLKVLRAEQNDKTLPIAQRMNPESLADLIDGLEKYSDLHAVRMKTLKPKPMTAGPAKAKAEASSVLSAAAARQPKPRYKKPTPASVVNLSVDMLKRFYTRTTKTGQTEKAKVYAEELKRRNVAIPFERTVVEDGVVRYKKRPASGIATSSLRTLISKARKENDTERLAELQDELAKRIAPMPTSFKEKEHVGQQRDQHSLTPEAG